EKLLQSRMLLGELAQLVLDVLVIVAAIDLAHVDSFKSNRQLLMLGFRLLQRHQKNRSSPQIELFPVDLDRLIVDVLHRNRFAISQLSCERVAPAEVGATTALKRRTAIVDYRMPDSVIFTSPMKRVPVDVAESLPSGVIALLAAVDKGRGD